MEVTGAVQGVGFRPHVYRLATGLGLHGWVVNDVRGVRAEVEGDSVQLDRFLDRLYRSPPPRAVVHEVRHRWLPAVGLAGFRILESDSGGEPGAAVLPDVATCPACREELLTPGDRRHRYAFINCTDCGPRFTIVRAMPYDRPNTTMAGFELCGPCSEEYRDPLDRRFHAQPNACPECGPRLAWWEEGRPPASAPAGAHRPRSPGNDSPSGSCDDRNDPVDPLRRTAAALAAGEIVAVKGLGGFHLICDARDEEAVARLRERKVRPTKPLAVMVPDVATLRTLCRTSPESEALLTGAEAPIVLLEARDENGIAPAVAPGHATLGVMLPYTPLHILLLQAFPHPVVATSGNRSDEPICTDPAEASVRLAGIADHLLVHDRPVERPVDDSVAWVVAGGPSLLRRSRGYAPLPLRLCREVPPALAVGGHMKTTVALARGRQAWLSQHVGDLDTMEAEDAFHRTVADLLRLYRLRPEIVAHDLHPDYRTTGWAADWARSGLPEGIDDARSDGGPPVLPTPVAVQHHHAHLASLLVEHGEPGPALGVVWDGTGYGTDGTVWGGEFLLGEAAGVERVAHLRTFRLPGGDAAVRDPRRVALALVLEAGLEPEDLPGGAAARLGFGADDARVLTTMIEGGTRSPVTSSAGRLLDGFSALLGVTRRASYEGEAAIALEQRVDRDEEGAYPFPLRAVESVDEGGGAGARAGVADRVRWIVDWAPALEALMADLRAGDPVPAMAARLHRGLVLAAVGVAERVGVPRVGLTGGCFQNRILVEAGRRVLRSHGFDVLLHRRVPPNDGGLSLGQVAVATARTGIRPPPDDEVPTPPEGA